MKHILVDEEAMLATNEALKEAQEQVEQLTIDKATLEAQAAKSPRQVKVEAYQALMATNTNTRKEMEAKLTQSYVNRNAQ